MTSAYIPFRDHFALGKVDVRGDEGLCDSRLGSGFMRVTTALPEANERILRELL